MPANTADTNIPAIYVQTKITSNITIKDKSIKDAEQAWMIYEEVEGQNKDRNETDALIWNKYGEGQPFDPVALRNSGQGNRYNFPTGFMSSIVDKVSPVPCKIIDQARYLTSASLSNYNKVGMMVDPEKGKKTEILREKITRTIRKWPDWKTFYTGLSQELVLIGRAFSLRLDPFTPWPKLFKTDQAFLPNGTGEHARNVQVIAAKQDYLVHELVNFIKDKEAAKDAGWNLKNCVKAINEALPMQKNDDGSISSNARNWEDCVREGNMGSSYSGATSIPVAHTWAVEANTEKNKENTVTHYINYRKGNHEVLFSKEDRYEKIEDLVTLFTLEPGNGKFYGSKGLGRKLINKHLAIERMRNRLYDQLEMSGLVILKTDAARAPQVQFKVRHPFILTTTDANIEKEQIEANVKSFMDADALMRDWTQHSVGQYMPSILTGDSGEREKTAREASIDFQREAEAKVAFLSRFWGQFADLVSCIQRGLLDPHTRDKTAKELQAELRECGVTNEEMEEFRNAPAAEVVQDLTQIQNQQIALVAAKYGKDPDVNSRELKIRDISAMTSPSVAKELMLSEQGIATNMIEGVRQQMIETEAMITGGKGMPVSPRDPHEIHLKTGIPDLAQAINKMQQLGAEPDQLGKVAGGLTHMEAHVQAWLAIGGDPMQIKQYQAAVKDLDDGLKKVAIVTAKKQVLMQDAMAQQQQQAQQQAQGPQVPPEDMIKLYKDAPETVRRQIEMKLGFQPPTAEEVQQEFAREATLKHPDLPEKIGEAAQAGAPPEPIPPLAPRPEQVTPPEAIGEETPGPAPEVI